VKVLVVLVLSLTIFGCKKHRLRPAVNNPIYSELKTKYDHYFEMAKNKAGPKGHIHPRDCDSLLWTGLYSSIKGTEVSIEDYEISPGVWLRRPVAEGNCYPVESGSEISRDMILGLMWSMNERKQIDQVNNLIRYGEKHDWIMGDGDPFRTVLSPDMGATIYKILGNLTDIKYSQADVPMVPLSSLRDYEAHLGVLHTLLRGKVYGYVTDAQLFFLKDQAARNPHNTLMQIAFAMYTSGDYAAAASQLLDETHWPLNRLPTNKEHCEFWLWQREMGPDWKPCEKVQEHSGADFLFAAWLILSKVFPV